MATITIRQLDDETKRRLRLRAAASGHSMEAEARVILRDAVRRPDRVDLSWIDELHQVALEVGGVELDVPGDEPAPAADLSEDASEDPSAS